MTSFIKDALRTESTVEPVYNLGQCLHLLQKAVDIGEDVDLLKKAAFYKKPEAIEALESRYVSEEALNNAKKKPNNRLLHAVLGCITESAEMAIALIKYIEGGELDVVNLQEEVGDLQWYQAILLDEVGSDFETEQNRVIHKLKERFPDKFTEAKANLRDLAEERRVLERPLTVSDKLRRLEEFCGASVELASECWKDMPTRNLNWKIKLVDGIGNTIVIGSDACVYTRKITPTEQVPASALLNAWAIEQFHDSLVKHLKGK